MLAYILDTIAPVFLVLMLGYISVRTGLLNGPAVDGIMVYVVKVGVPCLLFSATSTIDLASAYNWPALAAFYAAAASSFILAVLVSHKVFKRRPGESVAIGFGALFSNLVFLGLPITERALGKEYMGSALALVSLHAPFCYFLGISLMESVRADGRGLMATARVVVKTMFSNALMIGILLGFIVNLLHISLPGFFVVSLDMVQRSTLPIALVALGGILTRYRLAGDLKEALAISACSLFVHPLLVLLLCYLLSVPDNLRNVMVLMSAMAPGINAFVFASMYSRGQSVAASTVLISTILTMPSVGIWLWILVGHL